MTVKVSFETEEPIKKIIDALADAGLKVTDFELKARNYQDGVLTAPKEAKD